MTQDDEYWRAVLGRDKHYDGKFVFAVSSTGIYCRPSCPARRPRREHVQFFDMPEQAARAGFRACRRCQPDRAMPVEPQLGLIRQVCGYLTETSDHRITLAELAQRFSLSPFHLQRTFKRIVGVTPRQYVANQRLELLKEHLKNHDSVTSAIYEAGYQSSSDIYRQVSEQMGMTPASYRHGGVAHDIRYASVPCALGWLLVAATEQGICAVRLADSREELEATLRREFPAASIRQDEATLGSWIQLLLSYLDGAQPHLDLPLDVQITAFQRRVYEVLRAIPYGSTRTYLDIAKAIERPTASRAVARTIATNPVALVIPCHRVIRADGELGGYRWGLDRKRKLLAQESQLLSVKEKLSI